MYLFKSNTVILKIIVFYGLGFIPLFLLLFFTDKFFLENYYCYLNFNNNKQIVKPLEINESVWLPCRWERPIIRDSVRQKAYWQWMEIFQDQLSKSTEEKQSLLMFITRATTISLFHHSPAYEWINKMLHFNLAMFLSNLF